jgi:23S rRNA (adenine2030-N6)-methyltransferase
MKYRHSFHAGNFADVHKHVALLALLHALQRKDKGFLFLDTHAGAGRYELGNEARLGVLALLAAGSSLESEELRDYRDLISAWRALPDNAATYPGSPLLASQQLRGQDRGRYYELIASECRGLERALGHSRALVECGDGFELLRAVLPPPERRALVLIDPPYEQPAAELERATTACATILARLASAVIALWYPIKDERLLEAWQARLAQQLTAPVVSLELWLHARDSRVGLNGSGLLLINPPYRFEERARLWQQELQRLLDRDGHGGASVRTLIGEPHAQRPDA